MRVRTNSGVGVGVLVGVAVGVAVGASVGVAVGGSVGTGVAVSVGGGVAVGGSGVDVAVEVGAEVAVGAATVAGGAVSTASPCSVAGTGVEVVQPIRVSPNNSPITRRAKRSLCFVCIIHPNSLNVFDLSPHPRLRFFIQRRRRRLPRIIEQTPVANQLEARIHCDLQIKLHVHIRR